MVLRKRRHAFADRVTAAVAIGVSFGATPADTHGAVPRMQHEISAAMLTTSTVHR